MAKKEKGANATMGDQLVDVQQQERYKAYQKKIANGVVRMSTEELLRAAQFHDAKQKEFVVLHVESTVDFSMVYPDVKERWEKAVNF